MSTRDIYKCSRCPGTYNDPIMIMCHNCYAREFKRIKSTYNVETSENGNIVILKKIDNNNDNDNKRKIKKSNYRENCRCRKVYIPPDTRTIKARNGLIIKFPPKIADDRRDTYD